MVHHLVKHLAHQVRHLGHEHALDGAVDRAIDRSLHCSGQDMVQQRTKLAFQLCRKDLASRSGDSGGNSLADFVLDRGGQP